MSLLIFNFVIIYIIHKMLVLLKNYLNYLKESIFECFFMEYNNNNNNNNNDNSNNKNNNNSIFHNI